LKNPVSQSAGVNARLKPAGIDELPALLPLVRAYHDFEHVALSDADRTAVLRPLLLDPGLGQVWLIELDEAAVGYIALCLGYSIEFRGRDAFLDEFFIQPPWRGQGIGSAVLREVIAWAAGEGIRAVHLEVARDNHHARATYEKLGFVSRPQFHMMSLVTGEEKNPALE